jgi:malate synthase
MIEINPKVLREFKDLLGEKVVNERKVVVEELIEEMARRFQGEISKAVRARREWLEDKRPVREKAAFPQWDDKFVDADGNVRTFREIVTRPHRQLLREGYAA